MSANLLDGITPTLVSGTTESDGIWHNAGRTITDGHDDWLAWDLAGQSALETDQTYHVGLSVRGASADADSLRTTIGCKDAAGHTKWANSNPLPIGTSWGRVEATLVVPSGMTPFGFYVAAYGKCPEMWMASPTLSYGSPVTLASGAHTPYATQDHVAAEYATKAALKVTSDAVTAEVTERGRLAGRVGTLESTTGTHTSRLQQLAASITSLVKGESTYTDPDGKSATSGIYSLVTQTRDAVTTLFGDYTKTADLASTEAVRDAKKAGTDAASAASAAQSTANTAKDAASAAQSTADTAKSNAATAQSTADSAKTAAASAQSTASAAKATADGLATMIRQDADGVTVGKSADGKTWSTTRTRMGASAFEVLTKAGEVASSFGEKIIELGKNSADATIRMCGGKVAVSAIPDGKGRHAAFLSGDYGVKICSSNGTESVEVDGRQDLISMVAGYLKVGDGTYIDQVPMRRFLTAIQPVVLYNGGAALDYDTAPGDGTNGNVTLSETAANFSKLKIFFRTDDNAYGSCEVPSPDGKQVDLSVNHPSTNRQGVSGQASWVFIKGANIAISGTSITVYAYINMGVSDAGNTLFDGNVIYVVRVEGIR